MSRLGIRRQTRIPIDQKMAEEQLMGYPDQSIWGMWVEMPKCRYVRFSTDCEVREEYFEYPGIG